jgi:hypothetical protein
VHAASPRLAAVDQHAAAFPSRLLAADEIANWSYSERVRFLNRVPRKLSAAQLASLSQAMNLEANGNSEVRFAWLRLAVANRYAPAVANLEDFLTSVGRRKFVLPLYRDLMGQGDWGQALAQRFYAAARPGYHPVTVGSVDKVVTLTPAKAQ